MTRKQAIEYDNQLKVVLKGYLDEWQIDEKVGNFIVDKFVEFTPQDSLSNLIILNNEESALYNVENVRIDLKNAMWAGLELCASFNKPDSIFQYIQLLIITVFFVRNTTKKLLNKMEAYVVYQLHEKNAYQFGIEEEKFVDAMQKWIYQKEDKVLEKKEIDEAINHLYQLKVIDFVEDKIFLKERVFGKLN